MSQAFVVIGESFDLGFVSLLLFVAGRDLFNAGDLH